MKPIVALCILFPGVVSLLAKEESGLPPPPVSDKIYTFQQIEKQKAQLKDKFLRIEIASLVAGPGDTLVDGTQRYIVEDTSKSVAPYGQVAFPQEALEKMGRKGPLTFRRKASPLPVIRNTYRRAHKAARSNTENVAVL